MNKKYNLPVFDMILTDDTTGLYTISLVDDPAMEVSWYAFEKDNEKPIDIQCAQVLDEMEHKIMVVICRADFPIIRVNDEGHYFYVRFPKETIKMMSQRFLKNGYQGLVNLMHQDNTYVEGVEMEQLFVKDINSGIDPMKFKDIEDGSLLAIYKIENQDIWNDIMNGKYTSVSLEGLFMPVLVEEQKKDTIDSISDLLDYINN